MRDPIYPALRGMFHQAAEQSSQMVALAVPREVEKPVKPVHGDKAGAVAQGWELGPETIVVVPEAQGNRAATKASTGVPKGFDVLGSESR